MATLLNLGHWGFARIAGIITCPTLRPDGTILDQYGYDPQTHLWCAPDRGLVLPSIPDKPTREDALAGLEKLKSLVRESPFKSDLDRSVALAAMLTAVLRGGFDMAPMTLFKAHAAGSGKSFIVDLISYLVTGRPCPVLTAATSTEEMEKRLGAIVLKSVPIICLDNASVDLGGDLLCQVTERQSVAIRILGKSETPECEWRGSMFATGNNVSFKGDMVRRGLICNLDPGIEKPEQRKFEFNPVESILSDRAAYIAAALTIARGYRAVKKRVTCPPLGSYGAWSRVVREPLIWLGEPDPVESMEQAREDDPERSAARELIELWRDKLEVGRHYKAAEIVEFATAGRTRMSADGPDWTYTQPEFHALLSKEAGQRNGRDIDVRRFGKWLGRLAGQVHSEHRIVKVRASKGHGDDWALVAAPGPGAKG
jgi:putative DNA primase/helicase